MIALIELAEQAGLRMSGLLVSDPNEVSIGMPVRVRISEIGESGFLAPSFEPIAP